MKQLSESGLILEIADKLNTLFPNNFVNISKEYSWHTNNGGKKRMRITYLIYINNKVYEESDNLIDFLRKANELICNNDKEYKEIYERQEALRNHNWDDYFLKMN